MKFLLHFLFLVTFFSFYGQNNKLTIEAQLLPKQKTLKIKQYITYYNKSKDTLYKIVLRNWGNSYKNNKSPLAKRLLEDYRTDFYFAKKEQRGAVKINKISIHKTAANFQIPKHSIDLIFVNLKKPLYPNDSVQMQLDYLLKIPNSKFTGSGHKGIDYFLEDWHITPAIYNKKWILDSHQNLDYQHQLPTDYFIKFYTPIGYHVYSNFETQKKVFKNKIRYILKGKNRVKSNLSISFLQSYFEIATKPTKIISNFISKDISLVNQKTKMQQMLVFLNKHLDTLPQKNILIEKNTYNQNPIYELKYLPKQINPYGNRFKWEAEFFKALLSQYTEQLILTNKKKDYWFTEGLQIYLFTKYLETYYPNTKLLGKISNIWGLRRMNIAKQSFISKFSLLYQITARENLDQSLTTSYDKLSNYNKKITAPYKAGIGFSYLKEYVGEEALDKSILAFALSSKSKATNSQDFLNVLQKNTPKDIGWFQKEWIDTSKKIDHKIVATQFKKDSVFMTLKNNRSIKTPLLVYGLKNKTVKSKTWIDGFSDRKKIAIPNNNLDKIVLNYQEIYPEINYRNNWDHQKNKLFERPIQISLFKDLNNPKKNQLFLKPEADYNYYDGIILGASIQNKAFLNQNFEYAINPTYSFASNRFTGGFNVGYSVFPEKTKIYHASFGIRGSNYHYAPNLNYNTLSPSLTISFKQKDFRALGTNQITTRFISIDKEKALASEMSEEDAYNLFKVNYTFKMNQLIHNYQLNVSTEIASKFSKINTDFRYRHLSNTKRPIEFRFFGGLFLNNKTTSDYFSFNQHTANDYLFELPYLGRSETSGVLSRQYFKSQGGFVSQNNSGFANQWLTSINTSVGIYRWIEVFNNVSLLKSRNSSASFDYEGGIRLNFIPDILEFYLPIYNKQGLVLQQDNYIKSIRFVVLLKAQPIVKFIKRQLF